jgi:hypothetical protein
VKLWGAAMVRDEADVIETFVRHNLSVLDGLAIVDHGSTDGTGEILAALVSEGLPLDITADATLEHRQSAITSALVRRTFTRTPADYVFLLDADEFLKMPSRAALEADLATLPPDVHAVQQSLLYVPDFTHSHPAVALARSARRVAPVAEVVYKAVVSRHFADSPTLLAEGNHLVMRQSGAEGHPRVRHAKLSADLCAIAHVPIRSAEQYAAKIAVGWLACAMRGDLAPGIAHHWREAYAMLLAGTPLTPDLLARTAANYGVAAERQRPLSEIELIDDPFLADIRNAYDSVGRTDALALVLRFAQRMARQCAESARSSLPPNQAIAPTTHAAVHPAQRSIVNR